MFHSFEIYTLSSSFSCPSLSLVSKSIQSLEDMAIDQKERHRPWGFALYTGLNIDPVSSKPPEQTITCPGKRSGNYKRYIYIISS